MAEEGVQSKLAVLSRPTRQQPVHMTGRAKNDSDKNYNVWTIASENS
jgi:hypothetical protein